MGTFSVAFKVGSLELDAIVTAFDHHRRFKVELVTNEQDPIILSRSTDGAWSIDRPGRRTIPKQGFEALQKAIDHHLDALYAINNILVLIDFSDAAVNAAKYVVALSARLKTGNIILYHSLAVPLATDVPLQTPPIAVDFHQQTIEKLNVLKDDLQSLAPEGVNIIVRSDERTLISAVNMLADQQHLGLVVMGITGKSTFEQAVIGSNTTTVAASCNVPLLIVPAAATFKEIDKVVFACDLKKVSETTPARAIRTFIKALKAKLFIVNVGPPDDNLKADKIAEVASLHQLWDGDQPEYHYVDDEDLVTGIMDFANQHHAQLVITVPKEYGFFEGIFHRSVSKQLAYHTNLPLLLFREDK